MLSLPLLLFGAGWCKYMYVCMYKIVHVCTLLLFLKNSTALAWPYSGRPWLEGRISLRRRPSRSIESALYISQTICTIGQETETQAARWTLHPAFFLRILAVLKLLRRHRRSLSMSAQRNTNVAAHKGHRHPRILRGVTCMYTIGVWNCGLPSDNCAVRLRVFKLLWGCKEYAKDARAEGKSAVSVSSYAADCICCYYDLLHGST